MVHLMKTTALRFALSLALALAAASGGRAAKYAGEPFTLGAGARGLALGGAVAAGPFDATAAYWNPAGMARLDGHYLTAMHAETFGSLLNHDYVGFTSASADSASPIRTYGFYVYYLGGGGIKITQLDEFNYPYVVEEESHADILIGAALAGRLADRLDFGLTAKIIYRDIGVKSGQGLTVDAGLLYRAAAWADVGVMVTDVTTGFIRYGGDTLAGANTESIYPTVKPGLRLERRYREFTGRFMMSGDVKFESLEAAAQYWSGPLSLDTHFGWEIGYRELLFGRAGFDIGRFTAGGGVDVRHVTIDFAYLRQTDFDDTFRVSAAYRF